jgi:hypothetical protein
MSIDVSEEHNVSINRTEEDTGSERSMDIGRQTGESGALSYPTGVGRIVKEFPALQRVLFQPSLSLHLSQFTSLTISLLSYLENGGTIFLRNADKLLPSNTMSHPKR